MLDGEGEWQEDTRNPSIAHHHPRQVRPPQLVFSIDGESRQVMVVVVVVVVGCMKGIFYPPSTTTMAARTARPLARRIPQVAARSLAS